jgi:hypothetical protein
MMISKKLFSEILVFSCICLLGCINGYAQDPQPSDKKVAELDSVRFELAQGGLLSKEMIEKLSEKHLYDLIEAQIDKKDDLLETELDYYSSSGIPRFLTPSVALWSSIIAFLSIIAIVIIPIYFRHKKNLLLFDTINSMVAKGVENPSELLVLLQQTREKKSRLTIGVILSAIGLGIALLFVFIAGPDEGIWSIGLIPLLLGIGYLILWRLEKRQDVSKED